MVGDPEDYRTRILPGLTDVPVTRIAETLGVSVNSASQIRSGRLLPHVRHWRVLERLGMGTE